jgi:hypothetical protein
MRASGARRFRFAILISPNSISFATDDLLQQIASLNPQLIVDLKQEEDLSNLTNLTLYRLHLQDILEHHPSLNQKFSNLVRIRPEADAALPLEVTGFTSTTIAREHEEIRAEIAEEMYALLSLFNLNNAQPHR